MVNQGALRRNASDLSAFFHEDFIQNYVGPRHVCHLLQYTSCTVWMCMASVFSLGQRPASGSLDCERILDVVIRASCHQSVFPAERRR
jgi:hypothetical protein